MPKTPVKSIKRPTSAAKPTDMKRSSPTKVTDFKPSEIKRKKEEAKKPK